MKGPFSVGGVVAVAVAAAAVANAWEDPYCEPDNCYRNLIDQRFRDAAPRVCEVWLAQGVGYYASVPQDFSNCNAAEFRSACSCVMDTATSFSPPPPPTTTTSSDSASSADGTFPTTTSHAETSAQNTSSIEETPLSSQPTTTATTATTTATTATTATTSTSFEVDTQTSQPETSSLSEEASSAPGQDTTVSQTFNETQTQTQTQTSTSSLPTDSHIHLNTSSIPTAYETTPKLNYNQTTSASSVPVQTPAVAANTNTTTTTIPSTDTTTGSNSTQYITTIYTFTYCPPGVPNCPFQPITLTNTYPVPAHSDTLSPVYSSPDGRINSSPAHPPSPSSTSPGQTITTTHTYTVSSCAPENTSCSVGSVATSIYTAVIPGALGDTPPTSPAPPAPPAPAPQIPPQAGSNPFVPAKPSPSANPPPSLPTAVVVNGAGRLGNNIKLVATVAALMAILNYLAA